MRKPTPRVADALGGGLHLLLQPACVAVSSERRSTVNHASRGTALTTVPPPSMPTFITGSLKVPSPGGDRRQRDLVHAAIACETAFAGLGPSRLSSVCAPGDE